MQNCIASFASGQLVMTGASRTMYARHLSSRWRKQPGRIGAPALTKPTLSWSAISQYVRCSRQFWYARVARVQTGPKSSALFEGSCAHAALEWHYTEKRDRAEPSVESTIKYFHDYWDSAIQFEDVRWDNPPASQARAVALALKGHLQT